MFAVIYSFTVKENQEEKFEKAWAEMTHFIMKYENGLGSRLHKESRLKYIAYAQWPDKKTWQNAGSNLPKEVEVCRKAMKESCIESTTNHELELVEDLLIKT